MASDIAGGDEVWIGGSDAGDEGNWTWRNGLEAGQAFTYTNWNLGEPNNCCDGEDYIHVTWGHITGVWNDSGSPGSTWHLTGYVVEYVNTSLMSVAARRRKVTEA